MGQCAAVWRRLARADPDYNFADRVLADREGAKDESEVMSRDAQGNTMFRCTQTDTLMVEFDVQGETKRAPLCALHRDLPDLWKAERDAAGDDGSAIEHTTRDRWSRGDGSDL